MKETLILISSRPEDLSFMRGVASTSGFPLVVATGIEDAASKAAIAERPLMFADVSSDADFVGLYSVLEPMIESDPSKFSSSFMHFFTAETWPNLYDCAKHNRVGHLIFRNASDPEVPGKEYGRILRASLSEDPFGLKHSLAPTATVKSVQIHRTAEKSQVLDTLSELLAHDTVASQRTIEFLANATDELLMNAIYDAPAAAEGRKDNLSRDTDVELRGKRSVEVQLGFDEDYIALTVVDHYGSLNRSKLLLHLLTSYRSNEYQIDPTVAGAGLGLALTLRTGASLLFATELGERTEATVLVRKVENWREFKTQYRFVSIYVRDGSRSKPS